MDTHDRRKSILRVAAGAVLISFSAVFARIADAGPNAISFYRMAIGGGVLLALALFFRERILHGWKTTALLAVCGALFTADLGVWHAAIVLIGPGLATLLGNFQVFILAAFGVLFLGERIGWHRAIGIPLAVFGLGLIVMPGADISGGNFAWGFVFGLMTALTYASFILVLKRAQAGEKSLRPLAAMTVVSLVSAPLSGGVSLALGESLAIGDPVTLAALTGYGLLCQVLGWVLITTGLPGVPASRAGLLLLLQPVLTLLWDYLFFAKPVMPLEIVGAVIALGAIYLGSSRSKPHASSGEGSAGGSSSS